MDNELIEKIFKEIGVLGNSAKMNDVVKKIGYFSKSNNSVVFINGENGTGKELIAKIMHTLRSESGDLMPINCGAIPFGLAESLLFGHKKGSFSGATIDEPGIFLSAAKSNSTVFLDEIGELETTLQVKLLRLLGEKKILPVGTTREVHIENVRIICATNKNLWKLVKDGVFREDLYYRLVVLPINLPPLRERIKEDLDLFLLHFSKKFDKIIKADKSAIALMERYDWPGNIRELENFIKYISFVKTGQDIKISKDDVREWFFETGKKEVWQLLIKKGDYTVTEIGGEKEKSVDLLNKAGGMLYEMAQKKQDFVLDKELKNIESWIYRRVHEKSSTFTETASKLGLSITATTDNIQKKKICNRCENASDDVLYDLIFNILEKVKNINNLIKLLKYHAVMKAKAEGLSHVKIAKIYGYKGGQSSISNITTSIVDHLYIHKQ